MRKPLNAKQRTIRVLCTVGILLCAGFLYALICRRWHIGIPCPIYALTGLKCPGCGVTRMVLSLLHGDLHEAFMQNRAILLMLPAFVYLAVVFCAGYIRRGDRLLHGSAKVVAVSVIGVLLLFGILRNIFGW